MAKKPLKNNNSIAVAYIRVSTDKQEQSPTVQKETIRQWAAREGIEITSWHTDRGVSGGSSIEKRPALLDALESLASTRAGWLVVAKRDRLARDIMVAGFIELQASRRGAEIVSADGAGNGDSIEAKLMHSIINAFAEYERDMIRARTRGALRAKRDRGEVTGAPPIGQRVDSDGKTLVSHDREAELIRRVVEMRERGESLRGIAASLGAEGFTSRRGRPLGKGNVETILARYGAAS